MTYRRDGGLSRWRISRRGAHRSGSESAALHRQQIFPDSRILVLDALSQAMHGLYRNLRLLFPVDFERRVFAGQRRGQSGLRQVQLACSPMVEIIVSYCFEIV
jgi:hypothetical protein